MRGLQWPQAPSGSRARGDAIRVDARMNRPTGKPIEVGAGPTALAAAGGDVWVGNYDDRTLTRIDAETGKVIGQAIPVEGEPVALTVADGALWVASVTGTVFRIDPESMRPLGKPIPVGQRPTGLAYGEGAAWVVDQQENTLTRIEV